MQNLKQTKLSFTPVSRTSDRPTRPTPATPALSAPSTTKSRKQKPKQPSATQTRARGQVLDYVEVPRLRASIRLKLSANSSASGTSTSTGRPAQLRAPSMKRKFPDPEPDSAGAVHIPRINVNLASSPPAAAAGRGENRPSPPKKRRLSSVSALTSLPPSSPLSSVQDIDVDMDDFDVVPTSQSNEEELTLDSLEDKQQSVNRWRKSTVAKLSSRSPSPSYHDRFGSPLSDVPGEVDVDRFASTENAPETPVLEGRPSGIGLRYPQTPNSTAEKTAMASSSTVASSASPSTPPNFGHPRNASQSRASLPNISASNAFCSRTPPLSSDADHIMETEDVPIVQALDVKSKTEQLIADIRAKAFAAVHSSPEQRSIDLSDLDSDSSSDDDMPGNVVATLVKGIKGKGRARESDVSQADRDLALSLALEEAPRYNLRRASPSIVKEKPAPATAQPRKRKADPLGALLREKQREERTGMGMAAIRFAEEEIARSKAGLRDELDFEGSDLSADSDDDVVSIPDGSIRKSRSVSKSSSAGPSRTFKSKHPRDVDSDDEDAVIAEFDYKAFLGQKGGKAVGKILAKDIREKMAQALAKQNEEPLGLPFWSTVGVDTDMNEESPIPPFTAEVGDNKMRQLLKEAAECNNSSKLIVLLNLNFVGFLPADQYPVIVPWLFDIAVSDVSPPLSRIAYTQVLRLATRVGSQSSGLRLANILKALIRLGASPAVVERHGWYYAAATASASSMASDGHLCDQMIFRLTSLIEAYAQSFAREELSDVLLALLLVGMDPSTPSSRQTDIQKACDTVAAAMTPTQEFAACTKIVHLGKSLSPANQSLLVSLVPSVSPQTVRMARCIARSLLLDSVPSPNDYEQRLPDLVPLLVLLSAPAGSGGYFDIPGHSHKEGFYDELTHRLSILGKALSDIDDYALLEKGATAVRKRNEHEEDQDKDKEKEPKVTVLEEVTRQLDLLHGKIADTRAAHLDRSRAKAALQRLSFRIHYQRMGALKSGLGTTRPRNLLGYFNGNSSAS